MQLNMNKTEGQNKLYQDLISDGVIERISLDLVDQDPDQPRSWEEVENGAKTIAPSLKQHGLIQLPVYQKQPNGRYLVIVGACRTLGAKNIGWSEISAIIKQFDDHKKIAEIRWAENDENTRRTLKPIDEAKYWFDYIAEFYTTDDTVDIKTAALKMGINASRISQFLGIHKSSEVVKKLIIEQNITDYQLCYELYLLEKTSKLHFDEFVRRWLAGRLSQSIQINVKEVKKRAKKGLMPFSDMEVVSDEPEINSFTSAEHAENTQEQKPEEKQTDSKQSVKNDVEKDETETDQTDGVDDDHTDSTQPQEKSQQQEKKGKPIGDHHFASLDVKVSETNLLFKTNTHGSQLGRTEILELKQMIDQWCENDQQFK